MISNRTSGIVDVTLRDGGYLNNWRFPIELVLWFVKLARRTGVTIVEVGYLSDDATRQQTARCPPDLLRQLKLLMGTVKVAAMLRPKESAIESVLASRIGLLDLIRIPTDLPRLHESITIARMVKSSQISASINLTSVSAYSQSQLLLGIARLADSQSVDCLYLADSRGALRPSEVSNLISGARAIWTGTLGFHAHDNLGHAIVNSQVAIESGCDLVDGSVRGYGLGGGNADLKGLLETQRPDRLRILQHNALNKLAKGLNLPRHKRHKQLYQLAGAKNLEQEWVLPLIKLYGKSARTVLEMSPRRRYKTLADVLNAKIGNLERTGTG